MKRFGFALVGVSLLFVTGCGMDAEPSEEGNTDGNYEYVEVPSPNGPVPCIIWDGTRAGNITCDWSK